ncbi:MlaD family protein [Ramlibacter sp. AN1015]|uniref:MlaD family protein n=1 Tax=Ramlibacter sp. AN1015 TaxID=3133428 RepID=UPI0030BE8F89
MASPDETTVLPEPGTSAPVPHLALKARLLLLFTLLLIAAATTYVLYARGVFEPTQTLVLTTDDSEGVSAGMDMTFSGFPIGRVRRVELGPTGEVRILIDVATEDAHWLRTSSVFTLVRGLVGGTAIKAYTGVLTDPPLPDGAVRPVLRGDATADVPRVIGSAREVMENLSALTRPDGELRATLANMQAATARLQGNQGALGLLFGNEADARKLVTTLERTNALLARADQLTARADSQVFGDAGVVTQVRATVGQINGLLADTRASLRRIDAVLDEAKGIATDVRGATGELGQLRGEVEANLRKIDALVNDINRRWPFARDREVRLP